MIANHWPGGRRAALSLTFDNLGEAAELELGVWPARRTIGEHPSVTRALPAVLELLGDVRATFFVEGWNADVYPRALESIGARGHELALHGFRHERWGRLAPADEPQILERAVAALRALGLDPRGFRPPGGALTEKTPALLHALGFEYASPSGEPSPGGEGCAVLDDVVLLPFRWRAVDAYWLDPVLAGLRRARGDGESATDPAAWREELRRTLDDVVAEGGHRALVLHPYLLVDSERRGILAEALELLTRSADLWLAPCLDVARWLRGEAAGGATAAGAAAGG